MSGRSEEKLRSFLCEMLRMLSDGNEEWDGFAVSRLDLFICKYWNSCNYCNLSLFASAVVAWVGAFGASKASPA